MDLFEGLSDKQKQAVSTIDEDLEIIACAGAGKTGVVTRRIVNILKEKADILPENIVAFTFTEKAAEELKSRIYKYANDVLGDTTGFANMFIGTIHGFCLKMLQEYVVEFQKFSVLNEIRTKLFIDKYYEDCGMKDLDQARYKDTKYFLAAMSLLNENLFEADRWDDKTRLAVKKYRDTFYGKKYFDYSLIMQEMLHQLETNSEFEQIILNKVKYLTVDEYQDTNPIQERLIKHLKKGGCNLCIVGDDDQTIYEFRGSDSSNILTFRERYNINQYIVLDTDYRSSDAVIDIAQRVIRNNNMRLAKEMESGGKVAYEEGDTTYREFDCIEDEGDFIARRIKELHDANVKYSEIAILLRKHKFGSYYAKALDKYDIPYIIEGVNELFETPECCAAKGIFNYLNGEIDFAELFDMWKQVDYELNDKEIADAIGILTQINVKSIKFYSDFCLQQVFHNFLRKITIVEDEKNNKAEIILYNLGKFSQVIDDFESIHYATLPKNKLRNFCDFLQYTAASAYPEGYLSNTYIRPDAVNIMSVHQSKGLEFTTVFVPQLNHNNFPSSKMGGKSVWHVIDKSFIPNAGKIAGDDSFERLEEERKLFYVALTRAKKLLFLTRAPYKNQKKVSAFLVEAKESPYLIMHDDSIRYSALTLPSASEDLAPINLNFSILQDYFECAYRFKLSMFYGFVQPVVPAMGYGKAMHEIVQNIHRRYLDGKTIEPGDIHDIVEASFYLPYANPELEKRMRAGAEKSAEQYYEKNVEDFNNITMAEADIELDMGDGVKVNGRIDLVKRRELSGETKTFIVDFKTASRDVTECVNSEQLKIYALGYSALTGDTADYLEIYNLDNSEHERRRVTADLMSTVERDIKNAATQIRRNNLPRKCSADKCKTCYLNYLCLSKAEKNMFGI